MRLLLCLSLQLLLAASLAADPLSAEALWAMERVGAPQLSPDGRHVVFTVTSYSLEDDKGNSDLWLVPADTGSLDS